MMWPMAPTSDNAALRRLAELVRKRRVELGMHKIDVARTAGLTITTYSKIEDGLPVRDVTYGKVETVLGWALGTCRDVLEGATEAATVERSSGAGPSITTVPAGALEDGVRQAVQDVMVGGTDLQADRIRKLNRDVIDLLRERGYLPREGS